MKRRIAVFLRGWAELSILDVLGTCLAVLVISMILVLPIIGAYSNIESCSTRFDVWGTETMYYHPCYGTLATDGLTVAKMRDTSTAFCGEEEHGYRICFYQDMFVKPANLSFETELGTLLVSRGGALLLEEKHLMIQATAWMDDEFAEFALGDAASECIGYTSNIWCTSAEPNWLYGPIQTIIFQVTETGLSVEWACVVISTFVVLVCYLLVGISLTNLKIKNMWDYQMKYVKAQQECYMDLLEAANLDDETVDDDEEE